MIINNFFFLIVSLTHNWWAHGLFMLAYKTSIEKSYSYNKKSHGIIP